jgi:hypothetical protein
MYGVRTIYLLQFQSLNTTAKKTWVEILWQC